VTMNIYKSGAHDQLMSINDVIRFLALDEPNFDDATILDANIACKPGVCCSGDYLTLLNKNIIHENYHSTIARLF
jgi:hypothetical protein